jgi:Fe2+ or Zn2+ uptake regulation protein
MRRRAHGTDAALPRVVEQLRRRSRKLTAPRQAILAILRRTRRPLSTKEIFQALAKGEGDLATVYRSMHLLESMGIVKRFNFDAWPALNYWRRETMGITITWSAGGARRLSNCRNALPRKWKRESLPPAALRP